MTAPQIESTLRLFLGELNYYGAFVGDNVKHSFSIQRTCMKRCEIVFEGDFTVKPPFTAL